MMTQAFKVEVGNPARKLVLIKLADNANDQGECWPSYGHIAKECEMGKSTVRAHIKALEDAGFLTIKNRRSGELNQSNLYLLTLENGKPMQRNKPARPGRCKTKHIIDVGQPLIYISRWHTLYQPLIHPVSAVDRGVYQPLTPEPVSKNPPKNPPKNPSCATALHDGFEAFYSAGLPKKNRKKAEGAFKTQSKRHGDPLAFGKMLAENIKGRLGTGEIGFDAMHPATYLNQQRWLDEVGASNGNCPHEQIIDLWAEIMPEFRQHAKELWPGSKRANDLENRWNAGFTIKHAKTGKPLYSTCEEGIAWWGRFINFLRKSELLMNGTTWLSLEWIVEREHFDAILEMKYHDGGGS
ncbi:helix-turn-helix domain-containing protein [Vreelandella titanicae]|uniref:helix-turn-helix domain-containing protein n=1 Tax=Vreelandella titanicae TaxID=664683 RepID=UPI003D03B4F3